MNQLWSWVLDGPFGTMSLVDWVDMLLLAIVIYRVLIAMQGTRAMQSLVGLALLGALYVAAEFLGMSTTHWVLDNLFVYVVLALLILFQEDIRRVLARAGGTFSPSVTRASETAVAEEIIKAVFALAHRRVGALIVLERRASLEQWCDTGHIVDARVSTELLQAIFHPSSPLHDGAVVIRAERIAAASVFLPVSLAKEVSRRYGTRHRAALGITEDTDGVCLVVSEERGTVSLAHGGEITPVADLNDLRQLLTRQLEADEPAAVEASSG
ncbi:MAG: diadenylate cyclase [Myxococcota bacterium]|jgi:diadenylate cyclase